MFFDEVDYQAFIELLRAASRRVAMDVFAACLMPNHFHLVLRPCEDAGLARWMHWLSTSHVRRHQRRYQSVGRIWQGRFKAFPIQQDDHLLTVMRYVERNALRANLVQRAEQWPWGSAAWRNRGEPLLTSSPVQLPVDWLAWVNLPEAESELASLRRSAHRQAPFGAPIWQQAVAERFGLEHTLRPRGRPKGSRCEDK